LVGPQRRIWLEHLPKLFRERLILELVAQAPEQIGLNEHLRARFLVEFEDLRNGHPEGKTRGNDCSSARTGYVVEVPGKPQMPLAPLRLQQVLDPLQYFQRKNTPNAAAVDRE